MSTEAVDLKVSEAAPLLGIKEATVRLWITQGRLQGRKAINGQWRIPRAEIERALGYEPEAQESETQRA